MPACAPSAGSTSTRNGDSTFVFPTTWAPRLSAIYDVMGDGRQKISAFWGRYYDPIRNDMTNFAGSVSGRVREEQVWAVDEWATYRIRGGPEQPDALWSPNYCDAVYG